MSWSADALGRRKRAGRGLVSPELTVETSVPAEVSAVAYSRDPVDGSSRRLLLQCVLGEPDSLLAGEAAADEYALDRRSLKEIRPPLLADKRERLNLDSATGALRRAVVAPGLSRGRCLSNEQARRAARLARALDEAQGRGVEITFAFSAGKVYVRSWKPLDAEPAP